MKRFQISKSKEIVVLINPRSTSTKIALYNRSELINEYIIQPSQSDLDQFNYYYYYYQMVKTNLYDMLSKVEIIVVEIVGHGGIVKPLEGGTYRINNSLLDNTK